MENKTKKITKDQLVEMVTKITKQVISESVFSDPEVGADEYEEIQGLPMDTPMENGDEEFYDDFLKNPAEESFQTEEPGDMPSEDEIDLDTLLENKENKELAEKQDKLFSFITENWNHHANNLINETTYANKY